MNKPIYITPQQVTRQKEISIFWEKNHFSLNFFCLLKNVTIISEIVVEIFAFFFPGVVNGMMIAPL
jgi:hypothetical protein